MTDYDIVYLLNCKPVNDKGELDKNRHWRSAAVHYKVANLQKLNDGQKVVQGQDEFVWLTEKCLREWEGWMYDVSFCERDKNANHFRMMLDPRGSSFGTPDSNGKRPWRENEVCGWVAKAPKPENLHERGKMIPAYRADSRKLINIHGYDCFREYYVTAAKAPSIDDKWQDRNKGPITLFEKPGTTPAATTKFKKRFSADRSSDETDAGVVVVDPSNPNFVNRDDMPADVEAPLQLDGDWAQIDVNAEDIPVLGEGDLPSPPPADQNDDHFPGENASDALFADGEY